MTLALRLGPCEVPLVAIAFKGLLALLEGALDDYPQPLRATFGGILVGIIAVWIPDVAAMDTSR